MPDINLENKLWFSYLEHDLIELLNQSLYLHKVVKNWDEKFHDYSFVVFPAAKAYEGFLKKLFLDMKFITYDDYSHKYFRIGKALNPELDKRLRAKDSVYDRLVTFSGNTELADLLWETWKRSRNSLFHWFPNEKKVINFNESGENVLLIIQSIDRAFERCKIKLHAQ